MGTLILYKSRYGSTREYAEYLHKKIKNSDIHYMDDFDVKNFNDYEYIIIGSPTYAGQTEAYTYLINNWEYLKNKKIFVFTVGLIDHNSIISQRSYNTIPEDIREKIQYRKLPGKVDLNRLNILERLIFSMMRVQNQDELNLKDADPILKFVRIKI